MIENIDGVAVALGILFWLVVAMALARGLATMADDETNNGEPK